MSEAKYIEQKKQMFDEITFAMTLFCTKTFRKIRLLGAKKIKNPKSFFFNYYFAILVLH